jgi:hypothetical protein
MKHRGVYFPHNSPRLSRRHQRWVWSILGLAWASGAIWLVFHYGFVQHGEFGDLPHPLEGWSLRLHGAAAFASLWLLGLLWGLHITRAWPTKKRRATGIVMLSAAGVLVLSGYLLYYGGETLRDIAAPLHWVLGLLALPLAIVHMRRRRRAAGNSTRNAND